MADTLTIMHVEDEPDIREIARMSLEIIGGFTVIQFSGGANALAEASRHKPDLVLLDVMMPEMDGIETFRKLRALEGYSSVPIAFMTAKASQADNEQLMELGAIDVISKPFDPLELPDDLRAILGQ